MSNVFVLYQESYDEDEQKSIIPTSIHNRSSIMTVEIERIAKLEEKVNAIHDILKEVSGRYKEDVKRLIELELKVQTLMIKQNIVYCVGGVILLQIALPILKRAIGL